MLGKKKAEKKPIYFNVKEDRHTEPPELILANIVQGLGGADNINELDCCATRLRVLVNNDELVDRLSLRETGATGVLMKHRGVQVIYGTYVSTLKDRLNKYLTELKDDDENPIYEILTENDEKILQRLYTPIEGDIIDLRNVPDYAFKAGILGDGAAVRPARGELRAPADGKIDHIFRSKHAIIMHTDNNLELMLHIGLNTEHIENVIVKVHVAEGDTVRKGQLLIEFNLEGMTDRGLCTLSPIIIMNSNDTGKILIHKKERATFEHVALTVLKNENEQAVIEDKSIE